MAYVHWIIVHDLFARAENGVEPCCTKNRRPLSRRGGHGGSTINGPGSGSIVGPTSNPAHGPGVVAASITVMIPSNNHVIGPVTSAVMACVCCSNDFINVTTGFLRDASIKV